MATTAMQLDTILVYYEDYETRFNATVQTMVDFLHMSRQADRPPVPFIAGKHYRDHFTAQELSEAKQLYLAMASDEMRQYMDKYFEGIE
jgi:hypothetical protein